MRHVFLKDRTNIDLEYPQWLLIFTEESEYKSEGYVVEVGFDQYHEGPPLPEDYNPEDSVFNFRWKWDGCVDWSCPNSNHCCVPGDFISFLDMVAQVWDIHRSRFEYLKDEKPIFIPQS